MRCDMKNKIEKLRGKIKQKGQMDENPCPTEILFYLASGRQAFKEVNPWYNQLKEQAEGANRHYSEHHEAIIYGMYPELEEACEYFNEEIKAYFENNGACTEEEAQKIENKTIKKFNLKSKYSLINPTEEQKKRIAVNQVKATNIEFAKNMDNKSPIVKMLGYGLKDSASDMGKLTYDMYFLDFALTREPDLLKGNADLCEMAEKIFDLQKQGAITENFCVNDFRKVKQSALVQDMHYEGKSLNLADKIRNPHINLDFSRKEMV